MERLQETVALVDMLQERDLLERKLQEVRDLEERLQDVDELAEKLQEVIEEELGKEEVEQLRREIKQEEEIKLQAETLVNVVVKKSVQRFASEEGEGEVDELEEQIKEVFLKGLIPEEEKKEEVEVKRVRFLVEEEGIQLHEGSKEKLRQMEEEWKKELEEKSGSTAVTSRQEENWSQPDEPSRLEDTDVWFKVFDGPPLRAATGLPGTHILALNRTA